MMKERYEIPLLYDHHTHVSQYASLIDCLNIQDIETKNKAVKLIKERDEKPVIVLGWNSGKFSFDKNELDHLKPLIICNLSFHGFMINKPAEKLLKDSYPKLVKNIEDEEWVERNLPKILRRILEIKSCTKSKVKKFFDSLEEKGIWFAEDMLLTNEETLELIKNSRFSDRTKFWADLELFDQMSRKNRDYIEGVKLFTDGALGTSTAALKGYYKDDGKGILLHSKQGFKEILLNLKDRVDKIAVHAIGDRAIEQIVNVVGEIESNKLPEIRMEHVQFINENIAKKALDLDITLCMQPNFNSDSLDYSDRLEDDYLKQNNPFRTLIDDVGFEPGKNLIFGSDGMPHGVDYALNSSIFPPYYKQKLTLDEFRKCYCLDNKDNGYIEVKINPKQKEIKTDVKYIG